MRRPNNQVFEAIGKYIVDAFPESEILSTYYIAPIPFKKIGLSKTKSIPSRGKLVNKWRNLCTAFKSDKDKNNSEDEEKEEPILGKLII